MTPPPTHNVEIMKVMFPGNSKALQLGISAVRKAESHLAGGRWELIRSVQTSVTRFWTWTWETWVITSYLLIQQPSNTQFRLIIQFRLIAPVALASFGDVFPWIMKSSFRNQVLLGFALCLECSIQDLPTDFPMDASVQWILVEVSVILLDNHCIAKHTSS